MKAKLLFPSYFRVIGVVLTLAGIILAYICVVRNEAVAFLDHSGNSLTKNFAATFGVLGLIFLGFSRLKNEDEKTTSLRRNALYWGVLVGFLLIWLVEGLYYLPAGTLSLPAYDSFLLNFYPFLPLVVFLLRFYYLLNKAKNNRTSLPVYLFSYKPWLPAIQFICILFFLVSLVTLIFTAVDEQVQKILPDWAFLLFPGSLLIWAGSRQKNEFELTGDIRLKAMQAAVYINYLLLLIATWCFYGFDYLFIEVVSMVSIPILFLCVFYFRLLVLRKNDGQPAVVDY